MLVTLIGLALAAVPEASPKLHFERLDVLSLDPGTWLNYELPDMTGAPLRAALRFVSQVKPVVGLPVPGLSLGLSLASQSLHYERPLGIYPGLAVGGAVQTLLLLPRGVYVDLSVTRGPVRAAIGVDALSTASWRHLDWSGWAVLPGISLGVLFGSQKRAP